MRKLENLINTINSLSMPHCSKLNPITTLLISILYLFILLLIPLNLPQYILAFAILPLWATRFVGISFKFLFSKSIMAFPFIFLIAIFNPLYDTTIAFNFCGLPISRGWVSFISILLRGMASVQMVIVMIYAIGFYNVCSSLNRLGCPQIIVMQILFIYRYSLLIAREALDMHSARVARGYGRNTYPLREWTRFVGQLLIRSCQRADRVQMAMICRGFNGEIHMVLSSVNK